MIRCVVWFAVQGPLPKGNPGTRVAAVMATAALAAAVGPYGFVVVPPWEARRVQNRKGGCSQNANTAATGQANKQQAQPPNRNGGETKKQNRQRGRSQNANTVATGEVH